VSPAIRSLPAAEPRFEARAGVVVVGTGAAGMSAALEAAAGGTDVLVVSKASVGGGSTPWAQGGLAAVLDPGDSSALHVLDTATAGAGLCDAGAVETLVGAAPAEVARLRRLGARFDRGPLGLEGGHSRRRIVHAGGDASGAEVHRALSGALRDAVATRRLRLWEGTVALDLVLDGEAAVAGLRIGRVRGDGSLDIGVIRTAAVVVASGGFGQAYATTTNPEGVTGDGVALAARAGAEIADVEFVQFHPTVLWRPDGRGRRALITEALRGAGATLVDAHGRSVMAGAHPLGDLAPRDVVAATMQRHMATGDGPPTHLWLDATSVGARQLEEEFPTVTAACRAAGTDPATEPIPVAPGAHYACGGVRADMDGTTSIPGLYAVGEVAATGVHGANRLASNSLTESLATGRRAGRDLGAGRRSQGAPPELLAPPAGAGVAPSGRGALADAMSRHAGVLRHGEGLEHLLELLAEAPAASGALDLETVEATNLHTVSTLVGVAALARTESRGCHRRRDFPRSDDAWQRRLVLRSDAGRLAVAAEATA
jgi:L-aspartate oxidase